MDNLVKRLKRLAGTDDMWATKAVHRDVLIEAIAALESMDEAVSVTLPKPATGFKWAVVMDEHDGTHPLQQRMDALGVAIADAGYAWTPAMRAAYEGA